MDKLLNDPVYLRMQIDELKQKLNCPTCNFEHERDKILPCFHMFCKGCLDLNIEKRNRKCPLCRRNFDKADIKNIPWCSGDNVVE